MAKKTQSILVIIGVMALGLALLAGCNEASKPSAAKRDAGQKKVKSPAPEKNKDEVKDEQVKKEGEATSTAKSGGQRAVIETGKGRIVLEFYPDVAPRTVDNFIKLTEKGFYNGLTFHRVVSGFVIQGGDPNGDGTGGPGYNIPAEFNEKKHLRGTLAMARSQDPNSAGSQFYICLAPQPSLDNQYTVFGQVVEGIEVIDQITVGDVMTSVHIEPAQTTN